MKWFMKVQLVPSLCKFMLFTKTSNLSDVNFKMFNENYRTFHHGSYELSHTSVVTVQQNDICDGS